MIVGRFSTLSFLLCALFCAMPGGGIRAESMTARVVDLLNGDPLPGATVTLRGRLITTNEAGEQRLHPIMEGAVLGTQIASEDGVARFELNLSDETFVAVEVEAAGYEGQIALLMAMKPGRDAEQVFQLVREQLSATEAELVRTIHESAREDEGIEAGPFVPLTGGELRAAGTYPVPDEVQVQNLEGFTGLMNFDEFIGGVVTREMNDGFPREALRTQAVASRSYALHRLRTRGMANGGQAYNSVSGALSRAAAFYTTKEVLLYNGAVAQAFFSARCNGDFTLDSEDGPTLANCHPGGLTTAIVPYCRRRPCSGHVNCSSTSEQCCELTVDGKTNYIYGHGVGMCQRGAQQFASRDGWNYHRILTNYYTGIVIANTNSLQLNIVSEENQDGTKSVSLEVRSVKPNTIFDLQSSLTLSGASWSSVVAERGLSTGANSLVQVQPAGPMSTRKYYRVVLR
jgi:hypothetical protein